MNKALLKRLPMIFRITLILSVFPLLYGTSEAGDLNWDRPSESLLDQQYCPLDSAADAMVVQKETLYRIESKGKFHVVIFTRRRIKIYSEAGLENADITLPYYHYQKVNVLEATCYNRGSEAQSLDKDDIHDETWIEDAKRDIRLEAKTFAVPGARAGSVLDISYEYSQEYVVFLPAYVYQEDIPVGIARVTVMIPNYYHYKYFITNPDLIDVATVKKNKNPVLVATAESIPALDDEDYRPPLYNISSKMLLKLDRYVGPYREVELSGSWESLIDYYQVTQKYLEMMNDSQKTGRLVDGIVAGCSDTDEIMEKLFRKVRDDWGNRLYSSVYLPADKVDKMLDMETLDIESKSALLCSMLRHAGIDSDVLMVSSDEEGLRDFPCFCIFDHALVYIPSKNLYLDPSDVGAEVGIIDVDYRGKLALNITSYSHELFNIPEDNSSGGAMIDYSLRVRDDDGLEGNGYITFYYQCALEARREYRKLDREGAKKWLDRILFSDIDEAVTALAVADDSLQSADEFRIEFEIGLDHFLSPSDDFPRITVYPGVSFKRSDIDDNPPRIYPVYFGSKNKDYYRVVWEFGEHLRPQAWENVVFKKGLSVIGSFTAEYDSASNSMTVVRQYKNMAAIYKPRYARQIEEIRDELKKRDITSVILERK